VKPNEWPWLVALASKVGNSYSQFCGATLIAPGWAVTAGHCVLQLENKCVGDDDLAVIVGEHDLSNPSEHEEIITVKRVILHKDYKEANYIPYNDIALLELSKDASTDKTQVGSACLPEKPDTAYSEKSCYVAGWGSLGSNSPGFPEIAQHVKVNLVDKSSCNDDYRGVIDDGMLCAGGNGVDSCQGDSGGPLMCFRAGEWSLVGVVSWGEQCAVKPGVYADAFAYKDWIKDVVKAKYD